jgi:thiol-disulfide isomerase/thioredoxin/tetratricopeptide (TPR) repeat protein
MKRIIIAVMLSTVQVSYAQQKGIKFSTQKWEEVLAKAKATNKLIFVDVFTDWCGPCKTMDAEVFPLAEVGSVYNNTFVNYKIDAEKGEGPDFRKKYAVNSYPNYLFINGDGILIYRMNGSMPAAEFVLQAKNAVDESREPLTIDAMKELYPACKKDKTFMFNYLIRLTQLKLNTTDLLDAYISMLNSTEKSDPKTIQLLVNNGTWLNKKLQLGIAMTTLENNQTVFNELKAKNLVHGETLSSIKENAMRVSLEKAISQKGQVALQKVITMKSSFAKNTFDNKQTVTLKFLYDTHSYEQFKKKNRDFINNYLLKIPLDTLLKLDLAFFQEMKRKIELENSPGTNTQEYINSYKHTQSIQLCNFLVATVEKLLKIPLHQTELKEAVKWAEMALQIAATDTSFYKNVASYYQMVYAKACYKNGNKDQAIMAIKELLDKNSGNSRIIALLNELLLKMKADSDI